MPVMLSPGYYDREVDFATNVAGVSGMILGMVGGFTKGPVNTRTLVTSGTDFIKKFGKPHRNSYAGLAALQYLAYGNQLWVVRVAKNAATATVKVANDVLTFSAGSPGSWANNLLQVVISGTYIDNTPVNSYFDLSVVYDGVTVETYQKVTLDGDDDNYLVDAVADSSYISVVDANNGTWGELFVSAGTFTFTGGDDGITGITSTEVRAGLDYFANTEDIYINVLCTPGYSEQEVISKAIQLCETRGDCMYLVDPPFGLTEAEVVEWHNGIGGHGTTAAISSSYAALYWPWVKVTDDYNAVNRYVPPSGFIAGVYAYNDSVGEPWFAPAGLRRGKLLAPLDVEINAPLGSRDFMYSGGNAVNPIIKMPQEGIVVWGQRTLQRRSSPTDRVNVRRLLLLVRKAIAMSTKYLVFEPNDIYTWNAWKGMVDPFLAGIQSKRGLYNYKVIMDNTTVTDENIDRNEMPGKVLLQPSKASEMISVDFVLYKTGAKFE